MYKKVSILVCILFYFLTTILSYGQDTYKDAYDFYQDLDSLNSYRLLADFGICGNSSESKIKMRIIVFYFVKDELLFREYENDNVYDPGNVYADWQIGVPEDVKIVKNLIEQLSIYPKSKCECLEMHSCEKNHWFILSSTGKSSVCLEKRGLFERCISIFQNINQRSKVKRLKELSDQYSKMHPYIEPILR